MAQEKSALTTWNQRVPPAYEAAVALAGTLFSAILLLLTATHAGPLWRDEVNTANVAQMPSLRELWNNLPCESFPPLWHLVLRGSEAIGLPGSDFAIRILGLGVGLLILVSMWLCARWMGCRAPILTVGLLGSLPAFVFIAGSNRAYGLAACLLVLSFGMVWRVVEAPSRTRILAAGVVCLLYALCVYYDVVLLAAVLAGGAAVALRRRAWKTLAALVGIGAVSAGSLVVYLPIVRQGTAYVPLWQVPFFWWGTLWGRFGEAVTARSSGEPGGRGPEIWVWLAMVATGLIVAMVSQWVAKDDGGWRVEDGSQLKRKKEKLERKGRTSDIEGGGHGERPVRVLGLQEGITTGQGSAPTDCAAERGADAAARRPYRRMADRALFCCVSMVLGMAGMFAFLYRLHYVTYSWYYLPILLVCGISLDGILGANWPVLRPWGLLRIGFMLVMMAWDAQPGWQEAHTRRSNVDLIADLLNQKASAGDLVVVTSAWEGITFQRYYHGATAWVTVPPVESHLVHRNDLVIRDMCQKAPLAPVLDAITNALRDGHRVWMVGHMSDAPTKRPPACPPVRYCAIYFDYWDGQVSETLRDNALRERDWEVSAGEPVTWWENLPVAEFSGDRGGPSLARAEGQSVAR